jgi:pimeloyl-ACP methyl ester carboxylesterase
MLGSCTEHDWLFLCDSYGAFKNGTYYTGEHGDLFVERATLAIIDDVIERHGYDRAQIVTVGSSMGGTAALKFGLLRSVRGIVAIGPHIDLDISAATQDRAREVAFITNDGDWGAVHNRGITRQVRSLVAAWPASTQLPDLFVQTCADDVGVYEEQVLPLVDEWRSAGGVVTVDVRPEGGHTSDFATRPLLLDAVDCLFEGNVPDIAEYQSDPRFAATVVRPPLMHRVRRRLSLFRKRLKRS